MRSFLIAVIVVIGFSICCFTWVEGLECYSCTYTDGIGSEKAATCKNGKKPAKSYVKTCNSAYESCGKLYYEGKTNITDDHDVKLTMRGCIPTVSYLNGTCEDCTVQNLSSIPNLPGDVQIYLSTMTPKSAAVTVCSCNGDKCNSASVLRNMNGLRMIPVALFISKFAAIIVRLSVAVIF